jgi:thymidine kinase
MLAAFRSIRRGKRVAFLRNKVDTRDAGTDGISTHNGQLLPNDKVQYVTVAGDPDYDTLKASEWDVVLIEEAQFWGPSLRDFCLRLASGGADVYVAGLSGDLNMKPWPTVDAIAAIADVKEDVTAECKVCEAPAPFTICTSVFSGNVHPGTDDYHALCGDCRHKWLTGAGLTN